MAAMQSADNPAARLIALARQTPPFWQLLQAVRDSGLPNWCIGAGAVRSLVWDHLHGQPWQRPADIDIAYFDPTDLTAAGERGWAERLDATAPDIPWELTNQARVHVWYQQAYGVAVAPFPSLLDALASWPETATCVGLTLSPQGEIAVLAPYGLDDLFALTVRHNPTRVSVAQYRQRLAAKRWTQRWPKLTILPG